MGPNLDLPSNNSGKNSPKLRKPDDQAPAANQPTLAEDVAARQGDDGRPFCEKHQCLMTATGSGEKVTYYKCPVPGCDCKAKRIRPQFKMSAEPKECPHQTCRDPQQYLELAAKQGQTATLTMVCPKCGFKLQQPRPQFRPRENKQLDRLDAR